MAVAHQLVHTGGGDGHAELVVLDLAGIPTSTSITVLDSGEGTPRVSAT